MKTTQPLDRLKKDSKLNNINVVSFMFIVICLQAYILYGQSNYVYLQKNSKLIPEFQIITPKGKNGIRENFTYFKYRYWLGEIDTISMKIVNEINHRKSKKKKDEYKKYKPCDSIINKIRNSAVYWKMRNETDKIAKKEIGIKNTEFNNIINLESIRVKDFSIKCKEEFLKETNILRKKLIFEIERIKTVKINRLNKLSENTEQIDSNTIDLFLENFDLCNTDLKTIELIILEIPDKFITSIEKLSDTDFFTLTLNLKGFRKDSKTSKMKDKLRELKYKSKRKRKVIRKIKKEIVEVY